MKLKQGFLGFGCALLLGALNATAAEPVAATRPAIDPQADAIFKKMSDYLAGNQTMSFRAFAVTETMLENGQKVEFARNTDVQVARPNRLAATIAGDQEDLRFIYDGANVSIYNLRDKIYGQIPVPDTIDAALETLAVKHNMVIALADIVQSNPYNTLKPMLRSGEYLGSGFVFDIKCYHLAFRQENVDWQIWIDQGENPVPRKLVITYKENPARLQYVAFFTKWDAAPVFPAGTFTFTPPADAKKVEAVAPATQPAGDQR